MTASPYNASDSCIARISAVPLSAELLAILACPRCKGELEYREKESVLLCQRCRLRFEIRDGIPILLLDEAVPF